MNKSLLALAGTFIVVGLIAVVVNNKTSDSEVELPQRTIPLPNYANTTQTSIDCAKEVDYCPGAVHDDDSTGLVDQSTLFFPGVFGSDFLVKVIDSIGKGVFTGTLEVPYNATEVIRALSAKGKKYEIGNFLDGNATLDLFGPVRGSPGGPYKAALLDVAGIRVQHDDPEYHFITNALKQFYVDRYLGIQDFVNSELSKVASL